MILECDESYRKNKCQLNKIGVDKKYWRNFKVRVELYLFFKF